MYDIAIIGKGPAGVSAALNASIRNKRIIVFGRNSKKMLSSPIISNYPGLPEIKGTELSEKMHDHLSTTNVELSTKNVTAIYSMGDFFTIQAENDMLEAKTVILSVGVDFKKSIENEDIFLGNGVSYCATCDAPLYKGKTTCVIGYNHEAVEETKFLSELCSKVYFVPTPAIYGEFNFSENVEIIKDSPVRFEGKMHAQKLILETTDIVADGFFVMKDSYPISSLVPGLEVDGSHVVVNRQMETNIKGLYAAGDIVGKPYQIAKAVGEGQVAALNAVEFINKTL
jgi:thioredoxin reductase (NADPH)